MTPMLLRCGPHRLELHQPLVMGILNVTPDSFSDGGRFASTAAALARARQMIEEGADFIDIGGESTRPGAADVSEEEELRRVIPIVEALAREASIRISVDTSKPLVMRAALEAGACMINDVRALGEEDAIDALVDSEAAICLMHMQGEPRTMQQDPQYVDVVTQVRDFLQHRMQRCIERGIDRERIVIDPGIGFGKRLEHNLDLLAHLPALTQLDRPVLIGVSRKSMFRELLGRAIDERLAGGVAVATAAALAGAGILRVHDVAATVDAVKVATALLAAGYGSGDQNVA